MTIKPSRQTRNIRLTENSAHKLAQAITRRRLELGIRSARALGQETGLDYRTVTSIEGSRQETVSRNTMGVLEIRLGWPAGYLQGLLDSADVTDEDKQETVELIVPRFSNALDVERARVIAQATFDSVLAQAHL